MVAELHGAAALDEHVSGVLVLIGGGQVERRVAVAIRHAGPGAPADEQGERIRAVVARGLMEGGAAAGVRAVDVGPVIEQHTDAPAESGGGGGHERCAPLLVGFIERNAALLQQAAGGIGVVRRQGGE